MKKVLLEKFNKQKDNIIFLVFVLAAAFFLSVYAEDRFDGISEINDADAVATAIAVSSGDYIEQKIEGLDGNKPVTSINLFFGTFNRESSGVLKAGLYKDGAEVQAWEIPLSALEDGEDYSFELDVPTVLHTDSEYIFRVSEEYQGDNCVAVWAFSDTGDAVTVENGQILNGSLRYTLVWCNPKLKVLFWVVAILLAGGVVILILFKVRDTVIMSAILLVLMSAYMWICPLGMEPDAPAHLARAYEVANVSLVSQHIDERGVGGNYLPANILDFENKDAILEEDNLEPFVFGNTALYSPVSYLPQVIGIKIAGLFSSKVSAVYWGGKFGNAICAYVLCVLALCTIPFGKKILFLLMTFPMSLQEMVSISPDGFTIGLSLFFLAYILRLRYGSTRISKKDVVVLILSGSLVSLCKIVYVCLLLLLFMLPNDKFSTKKSAIIVKLGGFGIAAVLNLIWLKISSGFLCEFQPGVDSSAQVKFVLTNIWEYCRVAARTAIKSLPDWIRQMVGASLGKLDIQIASIMWLMVVVLLLYEVWHCYGNNIRIKDSDLVILLLSSLAGVALIFTSLYVQWTPLGNDLINGIQGRYFIPVVGAFLFFVILMRQKKVDNQEKLICTREKGSYYYLILIWYNGIALLDLIKYYIAAL